jgi:YbbR domain-containing protein
MGLSEKTDAMVVVVSEERGQVSIFVKGTMTPMKSEEQVAQVLVSHCRDTGLFRQRPSTFQGYKKIFLEVAGSLAIALLMWVSLISGHGEMLEKIITVPVEYTATAEDVVMTGSKVNEVRLHLAGSKSDFDTLSLSNMSVKVSLAKLSEGKQTLPISRENIRLPRGISLLDMDPPSLEVSLAKLAQASLPIKPQIVGKLPQGVRLVSIEVRPDTLSVFLPSGDTGKKYKNITTTPVYLDNIRETTTLYCKIISPPAIQPVDKRWPDVEVLVTVRPDPDA